MEPSHPGSSEAGALRAPALLMEDHRDAYFFWKELGLRRATCVHVDAHLDACGFKLPGYTGMQQPEIHCGNYLRPALAEEIVERLVWVVPPHLSKGADLLSWTQEELQRWMHLKLSEYRSLHGVEGRVEGELAGRRLVVCESGNLPGLEDPVLLDIDVDYYLGPDDEVWQTPLELAAQLPHLSPAALTVAYSVEGGYTPPELRYLGDMTLLAFQEPERAGSLWEKLHRGEGTDLPDWLRAAALLARARGDYGSPAYREAAALHPGYALQPVDVACYYLERERFERARPWLEQVARLDPAAAAYLSGYSAFRQARYEAALDRWEPLLQQPLDRRARRHLLEMAGRAQAVLGRLEQAIGTLQAAVRLDSRDASLWLELGRTQTEAGREPEAARSYRRALSLEPDLLITAQAQLELARIYDRLGQTSLARAQRARLRRDDLPAALRMEAEMSAFQAARARR